MFLLCIAFMLSYMLLIMYPRCLVIMYSNPIILLRRGHATRLGIQGDIWNGIWSVSFFFAISLSSMWMIPHLSNLNNTHLSLSFHFPTPDQPSTVYLMLNHKSIAVMQHIDGILCLACWDISVSLCLFISHMELQWGSLFCSSITSF
ncbi:hypothetical protein BGX38DRAFT_172860 [Terfezia claveryi]|nr:hypothetical protein BGX38DRAFT_172860 [Terfezia claveryi]